MVASDHTPTHATGSVQDVKIIGRRVMRPREQVETLIRSAILASDVKSGERLPSEAQLAKQFDVSRTTVREALRSLTSEGLIRKTPGSGGGSFVQSIDHNSLQSTVQESLHTLLRLGTLDFSEVAMIRQYLEVPSARLAAVHRNEQHLAKLRSIVEQQKKASIEDPAVPGLDAEFHALIAEASSNRVLAAFVRALHSETEPVHYLNLSPEVGRETVRQHQRIVHAITQQDPDGAEAAVVEHLTYLREHIDQQLVPSKRSGIAS